MPGRKRAHEESDPEDSDRSLPEYSHTESATDFADEFSQRLKKTLSKKRLRPQDSVVRESLGSMPQPAIKTPAEAGIVLKLELHNFMCHHSFSIDFGEQTNFITGRNGSGKSAVLTGLSVAMGAKAYETDRGTSLKGLIMHGKNVARAKVTFKNEGEQAYHPELYGDRISIERVIKAHGSATCSVRSESGKVISNKKRTISDILDHFGIMIANPMTILTQTEAKTFLAHSDDKSKFKFFMKGTRLQEACDNVSSVEKDLRAIVSKLDEDKEILVERRDARQKARETFRLVEDSAQMKERKVILEGKLRWLDVIDDEGKRNRASQLLKERADYKEALEAKLPGIQDQIKELTEDCATTESMRASGRDKLEEAANNRDAKKRDVTAKHNAFNTLKANLRSLERDIADDRNTVDKLEKQISKEQERIQNRTGEEMQKLVRLKANLQEQLDAAEDSRADAIQGVQRLQSQRRDDIADIDREIQELQRKHRELEQNRRTVQQSKNGQLSGLSPNLQHFVTDIRHNQSRFKSKVVGPLGVDSIKLKQQYKDWRWVLEAILQRSLATVLADNFNDSNVLKQRSRFFKINNDITTRKPEEFDFSRDIPSGDHLKVMDVLRCSGKDIECFLVDANQIHKTLLYEDRRAAEDVLLNDTSNSINSIICKVPRGAVRISKRNGTLQIDPVEPAAFKPAGYTTLQIIGDDANPAARIAEEIKENERQLQDTRRRRTEHDSTIKKQIVSKEREAKEHQNRCKELRMGISKADAKMDDLEGGTAKVDAYQEEKSKLEDQITLNIQQKDEISRNLQKAKKETAEEVALYKEATEEYKGLESTDSVLESKINDLKNRIEQSRDEIRKTESQIEIEQDKVDKLQHALDETFPKKIQEDVEKAEQLCTREEADMKPDDSEDKINRELASIERSLEMVSEQTGISLQQAAADLKRSSDRYKETEKNFREGSELVERLRISLNERKDSLCAATGSILLDVGTAFQKAMRLRNFKGEIDFDSKNETLTLKVATKLTDPLRNVESFSGGEKSYAQVSFLLSIWEPMKSRVRGLDEFDVYMDPVNRRMALKLILEKVATHPQTQTIFITPLSIDNIQGLDDPSVHIHEITAPERTAH